MLRAAGRRLTRNALPRGWLIVALRFIGISIETGQVDVAKDGAARRRRAGRRLWVQRPSWH